MNDCESCMLHYYDDGDRGDICIGEFDEFDKRETLLYSLRRECASEIRKRENTLFISIAEEMQQQFAIDAAIRFPCKYHTTHDEFIAWKESQL